MANPAITRSARNDQNPAPAVGRPAVSSDVSEAPVRPAPRSDVSEAPVPVERPGPVVPQEVSAPSRPAAMHEYRPSHIDAKDAIAFAALRMKDYYNARHQPQFFNVNDLVNLRLHKGYQIPTIGSKKIGPQLIGPFKIIERIGRLAYRLHLPDNIRTHNVVSITHLDPATDPALNLYYRYRSPPPTVVIDGEDEYQIEKLVRKRRIRKGRGWSTQYLIR